MSRFPYIFILFCMSSVLLLFQNCSPEYKANTSTLASKAVASVETDLPAVSNQSSFDVQFQSATNDTGATYTCKLDNLAELDCSAHVLQLVDLADGDHVIEIKKGKGAPARFVFRVDTKPPVLEIQEFPADISGVVSSLFRFGASDDTSGVTGYECSLNGNAYATCSSPLVLANLGDAHYDIKVRARDKAKNYSNVEIKEWIVDTKAPVLTYTQKPAAFVASKSATIAFTGTDEGKPMVTFECRLNGGAFTPCTSPVSLTALAEGTRNYQIRGTDSIGHVSAALAISWVVDTIAPLTPVITADITSPTNKTTANFSFVANETAASGSGIASYACALDGAALAACTSPVAVTTTAIPPGSGGAPGANRTHTFSVQATDKAGNVSPIAVFNWTQTP